MLSFSSHPQFQHILKELGLTPSEALVYSTVLTIGPNPASTIAKKAQLNRSSCYTILEQLKQKGLMAITIKDNIRYFSGIEPYYLIDELKNKKTALEQKIQSLMISLRQVQMFNNPGMTKSPRVVFFDGQAGIRHVIEETLQAHETLRAYASLPDLTQMLPGYFPAYYHRRSAKNIFVRAMYPATKQSYIHKLYDGKECRMSRLIPGEFDFHMALMIYDDKVAITSFREMFGVVMQSREIAEAQKRLFDLIWHNVEWYDQKVTQELAAKFGNPQNSIKNSPESL